MNTVSMQQPNCGEIMTMLAELSPPVGLDKVEIGVTRGVNGGVSLTISAKDGSVLPVTVDLPAVDPAEGSPVGPDEMEAFADAVGELAGAGAGDGADPVADRRSALTDLYAVLALLYQVAQKQRETAMKSRAASHQSLQASLQAQSDKMMTNAETAYTQAYNSAVLQAWMTGISVAAAATSFVIQVGNYGFSKELSAARADVKTAQGDLDLAKQIPPRKLGQENEMMPMGEDQPASLQATAYIKAKGAVTEQEKSLTASKTALATAEKDQLSILDELEKARKAEGPEAKAIGDLETRLSQATTKVETCQSAVNRGKADLEKAKIDCGEAALAYSKELDAAVAKNPKLAGAVSSAKENLRDSAVEGLKARLDKANSRLDAAYDRAGKSRLMLATKGLDLMAQSTAQGGKTAAAFMDAEAQRASARAAAGAKKTEAEQERIKAQTESVSDLCRTEQDLLNFINQMLQQVNQAEGAAVRSAIRA